MPKGVRWSTNLGRLRAKPSGTTRLVRSSRIPLSSRTTRQSALIARDTDGNQAKPFPTDVTHDPEAVADNTRAHAIWTAGFSGRCRRALELQTCCRRRRWRRRSHSRFRDSLQWLAFDPASGRLEGVPGAADVGPGQPIVISTSDGIAVTELPPFSITVVDARKTDDGWRPEIPADSSIIVEVENHEGPVAFPRGDVRTDVGGVIGRTGHFNTGRDQVLLHSWPLQILLTAGGQLGVADLQRDTRYVHPESIQAGETAYFSVACSQSDWSVNVGGSNKSVPKDVAPKICISATWGKAVLGATDADGTAKTAGPFDLIWFGLANPPRMPMTMVPTRSRPRSPTPCTCRKT